jgi:uncharacterized protein YndB with AHSA1/START domain
VPERKEAPETRTIEAEIELDAPLDVVWKALTDAEELTHWFPLEARVKPGPGGNLWMSWGKDFEGASRIEIWDPPHRFKTGTEISLDSMKVVDPGESGSGKTQMIAVDYRLEGKGGKTVLRLVHSGFGTSSEWDEEYDSVSRGWPFELWGLRHYLQHHRGKKRAVAWVRVVVDLTPETIWERLRSEGGFFAEGQLDGLRSGDRYSFRTAGDDKFEGVLHVFNPPFDFYGTVENLGNAILRTNVFGFQGRRDVHLWISTYDVPQGELDALRRHWQKLLAGLFPEGELR